MSPFHRNATVRNLASAVLIAAVLEVPLLTSAAAWAYGSGPTGYGGNQQTGASDHSPGSSPSTKHIQQIVIPPEDRFTPISRTIRIGDTVEWINNDTDDHTVVSDDAFNTVGAKLTAIDQLVPGTDSNGGTPGTFQLRFKRAGTFVYYCRFHSHLDAFNQPVAPGPDGGIEDGGNFGTPMMGVITVVPRLH